MQLKESSILVEPDIPIYDLREAMKQVGYPVEPRVPLFDTLQVKFTSSSEPRSVSNVICCPRTVTLHRVICVALPCPASVSTWYPPVLLLYSHLQAALLAAPLCFLMFVL